jgi:hypothetical protein
VSNTRLHANVGPPQCTASLSAAYEFPKLDEYPNKDTPFCSAAVFWTTAYEGSWLAHAFGVTRGLLGANSAGGIRRNIWRPMALRLSGLGARVDSL